MVSSRRTGSSYSHPTGDCCIATSRFLSLVVCGCMCAFVSWLVCCHWITGAVFARVIPRPPVSLSDRAFEVSPLRIQHFDAGVKIFTMIETAGILGGGPLGIHSLAVFKLAHFASSFRVVLRSLHWSGWCLSHLDVAGCALCLAAYAANWRLEQRRLANNTIELFGSTCNTLICIVYY